MSTPSEQSVRVFADPEALAEGAAVEVRRAAREAMEERGVCSLVLAGGSTPRRLYRKLAEEPCRSEIDWSAIRVFFGDERSVPPDDPASNYAMARATLLSRVPIEERNVHRIAGELKPGRAAIRYEEELRRATGAELPRFDLVVLGMGTDGHTASLFPGTPKLLDEERLAIATVSPCPPRDRVTLTLRALNAARGVMFLVQGAEKSHVLGEVLAAGAADPASRLPAASVRPKDGELLWLVDRAAAPASWDCRTASDSL